MRASVHFSLDSLLRSCKWSGVGRRVTLWQCRPHDISQRCWSRGCSILMSVRCARLGQARPLSGLVWMAACAPPETTLPHSQPHHRSAQWDNLSPLLQEKLRDVIPLRADALSGRLQAPAVGLARAGWVGAGRVGWAMMNGAHLVVSVRAGRLRCGGLPPACPRQRVAGGSSQGHINQTLHLPLFHCLALTVSLLVFLHILNQSRRTEQWDFEPSQSKASVSDSGHFTAKPWTFFLHFCTRCLMLLWQGKRFSPLSCLGVYIKAQID